MIDELQFVRPDWFYAFIPLAVFIVLMFRLRGASLSWKAVCDSQLLPYILTGARGKSSRFPLVLVTLAASLCIIAAAGPVFKKVQQPIFREQSSLVVIMDLSQSMDATDLRPSRIERAKLKLLDILKSRKGGQTALIAYAANAFVVTPLTDDTNTIANLVPTLKTNLMPAQGSRAYTAINKAAELLQQAGATSGDALLITDGISNKDNEAIATFTTQGHRLSILGVGTADGSPVPLSGGFLQDAKGAIVIPKLNSQQLQRAALKGSGIYVNLQADDSDIERLGKLFTSNRIKSESETPTLGELKLTADTWQEEGPWLLLLVIPLAALWSRKGWLLCVPVLALSLPDPSYALDMDNLWSSSDQKAMRTFNAGDTKRAAEQFEDNRWKSSAYYRAGDYEKALETINEPENSNDFYNKGNALAKLGRYPEAIKAYDEAISLDGDNEDALYNRELVKKEMQNQQSNQQQDSQSQDEKSQNNEQGDNKQQDNKQDDQQQSSESDSQSNQDQQHDKKGSEDKQNQQAQQDHSQPSNEQNSSEKNTPEDVKQAMKDAWKQEQKEIAEKENANEEQKDESLAKNEATASEKLNEELSEDNLAAEQWLKRIPDDPGQLLRRKFHYQYRNMQNQTTDEQPW